MAQVEGVKNAHLYAVAFHMYEKCKDDTVAFEQCYANSSKPTSECANEYNAVVTCAKDLISEAAEKAKEEWHHYTHCLDLMNGKYNYCRPEQAKFREAFPA
jgi:hypothetical protein